MNGMEHPRTEIEETSTRGSFLKRLGMTLAAGVGVAAAFASAAFAEPLKCCRDCSCGTCTDVANGCRCRCDCSGIGKSYCWTEGPGTPCLGSGCVNCPC